MNLIGRWLVLAAAVAVLAACGSGSGSSTRATVDVLAKVDYPGRLLLSVPGPWDAGSTRVDHLSQLTAASPDPTDLQGLPASGYLNAVSADGSLLAYNAGQPETTVLSVVGPTGTQDYQGRFEAEPMVFSPDGLRLASNARTSIQISDPATHRFSALPLPVACKSYSHGPADGTVVSVCGEVGGPVWLDASTLYLTHFVGELPSSLSCPDSGRCTVAANTAATATVTGTVTDAPSLPSYDPVMARGKTVVLDGASTMGAFCSWIDTDELRAGTAVAKPLPPGSLMHSLSPDGTRIVVAGKPGTPWQLVDIRTGAVQDLGTRTTASYWPVSDVPVFWSPDGRFFAVQVGGVLVPHSKKYGSYEPSPGANHFGTAIWVVPASSAKGGVVATLAPSDATAAPSASEAPVLVGWAK